jgi:REP element-mobilizing transposase RayT
LKIENVGAIIDRQDNALLTNLGNGRSMIAPTISTVVWVIYMDLPKRKQNRLTEYDYSTPNAYFITICTQNRKRLFWANVGAIIDRPDNVPLTNLGKIVRQSIENIPAHYRAISVDHYVIMPNHIHLLLRIDTDADGRSMIAPTISTVVRHMKGIVTKQAGFSLWQKGFYDHVIRNDIDYREIWNYIEGNPGKWEEDKLYISDD